MSEKLRTMLSIELVPRSREALQAEAEAVASRFDRLTWLNIPDIKRLPLRSHDAALALAGLPLRIIPHLRARDRSVGETVDLCVRLAEAGIRDVLIVTGDPVADEPGPHPNALDALRAIAAGGAPVRAWAAFDPYRGDLRAELDYARAKLDAGAHGLFTQPFFDPRYAEICLDQLDGVETFLGISPVTNEKSRKYWERTNRVVFPRDFEPTLEHCARLTARLIRLCEAYGQHAYLMPIRVDAIAYLEASFARLDADAPLERTHP